MFIVKDFSRLIEKALTIRPDQATSRACKPTRELRFPH